MHIHTLDRWQHPHNFHSDAEFSIQRIRWVIVLMVIMMVGEITAGMVFGSMALLADGWHMGTHGVALGIALFACQFARAHANSPRYLFGNGKVNSLGGFGSAVALIVVALLMGLESIERLFHPQEIRFDEAMMVAVVGLVVNVVSARVLHGGAGHDYHHHHEHHHDHGHHHQHDHNLRAAYLHVLAGALTSGLAIVALFSGKMLGWIWMDALMGLVGAAVITVWGIGLLTQSSEVLLDESAEQQVMRAIRKRVEADADNRIADLHVWKVGPLHHAATISLVTHQPRDPEHYKGLLASLSGLSDVTVEVNGERCC